MTTQTKRDSMVFYDSFFEAIADLPAEEFKKCACAILGYGLRGEVPETTGIEKTIFILAKPQIDKNNQRWINAKKSHGANEEKCSSVKNEKSTEQKAVVKEAKTQPCIKENNTSSEDADFISLCENIPVQKDDIRENTAIPQTPSKKESAQLTKQNEKKEKYEMGYDACGEYENVFLTTAERAKLICELTLDGYLKSVDFLSRYIKRKPDYNSACHYEDIRGWVKDAVAERQQKAPETKNPSFDFDFEDIYERP